MVFLKLAITNLRRHGTRSLLTALGIATSVAVLFSILSFNKGFSKGLARELQRTGIHFMVVPSGCPHEVASLVLHGSVIPKFLNTSVMEKIVSMKDVDFATPILVTQLPNAEKARVDLVYGMEMSRLSAVKPYWEVDGKIPSAVNELMAGSEIASHNNIRKGDLLTYSGVSFKVSGILKKTGSQDDAFIYMPVEALQAILKKPSGATAIGVKVKTPETLAKTTDELAEIVPGIQVVTMNQVMSSISNLAASGKVLSLSIAIITILVSAVGVMNSMLMAVFERTQEIGMMRAIGASRADIFRIILKEAAILTLFGGLSGIAFAVAGSDIIEKFVRKAMPYIPSGSMVDFDPVLAAASLVFVSAVGIISGLYPSWKAAKISPIEAIKG